MTNAVQSFRGRLSRGKGFAAEMRADLERLVLVVSRICCQLSHGGSCGALSRILSVFRMIAAAAVEAQCFGRFLLCPRINVKEDNSMKKLVSMALVLLMTVCLAGGALAEGTLRVGMECDYAPYNWTQTEESETSVPLAGGGYADGYDVQMAKLIAEGLGMELEIVKTAWDGLPMGVMSGKIDAIIAGMSATEERKVTLDFTDNYYESDLVIVVRADSPYAEAKSLADFAGAKLTGQLNTFHYDVLEQATEATVVTAMETFPAMIVALNAGAIDGYVSERPGAVSAVASNPNLTFVAFEEGKGFVTSPDDTCVAVAVAKGSELTEKINEILAGITAEQREELMQWAVENQPLSEE